MANNSDAIKREMYRTSLDSIRVYNPTDTDFTIVWDGFKHTVPSKSKDTGFGPGQRVMPRYLAMKWCRDMKNKIMGEESEKKVQEMIASASQDMKIKYEADPLERQKLYGMTPTINDPKEIQRIYDIIWLGVEERYGIEQESTQAGEVEDQRPVEEQILDSLNRPVKKTAPIAATPVTVAVPETVVIPEIIEFKCPKCDKVAKSKFGLETHTRFMHKEVPVV
jgi:hypothetical protein